MLMRRIADEQRLPFGMTVPTAKTRKAIAELEAGNGKRAKGLKELMLENTADILLEVAHKKEKLNPGLRVIGFAAETEDIRRNAQKKLESKRLDMIVVNDITTPLAGFNSDTNQVSLLFADGSSEDLPLMKKSEVADKILQTLLNWLAE
mgnify:CR=1 FL=1